ncbi:unnamed protein product [Prorocentrum cordatum]|uniref:Uncharacterized protein n=1 Tax=Prorocentrum cordatum TaxID=2364126 RepID=A0ABN9TM50_9DINO|nr:unnamed protein product [Polarella glacialis]
MAMWRARAEIPRKWLGPSRWQREQENEAKPKPDADSYNEEGAVVALREALRGRDLTGDRTPSKKCEKWEAKALPHATDYSVGIRACQSVGERCENPRMAPDNYCFAMRNTRREHNIKEKFEDGVKGES